MKRYLNYRIDYGETSLVMNKYNREIPREDMEDERAKSPLLILYVHIISGRI